ncbi:MAG: NAD(+) synthase, partial [Acidobacteriota bacterium]
AANQSARCLATYVYAAAGAGESTTDLAWDGHGMIYENGNLLAQSERFSREPQLVIADIDLERLVQERLRQNSFGQSVRYHREALARFRVIEAPVLLTRHASVPLERDYERFPYVPSDPAERDQRCHETYEIQVQALATRLESAGIERVVIGVSGGLDSTHALIVCARAIDLLGLPRENLIGCTMPGFATGQRTLQQARELMRVIGCRALEIDIRPSCRQMLADIGHSYADGEPVYDVTFENVQAGERTSHLFRLANLHRALVVGTGDLSELALGWQTYGVGDHMSHYSVNASVPKTLIQFLIRWVADTDLLGPGASAVLRQILETEISPELVPATGEPAADRKNPGRDGGADDQPAQSTEAEIGPYELHDFFLYYTLRYGYAPPKVALLASRAWASKERGTWPAVKPETRREYTLAEIKHWLRVFLDRFFRTSQFKRSCVPNAPKVGSGGSLSPRGDYRAPSDSSARAWLEQLDRIPDRC